MNCVFDSDVLIDFFKFRRPALDLIKSINTSGRIVISTVTITELRSGWTVDEAEIFIPQLYDLCLIKPVTIEIAEQAGIWRKKFSTKGLTLNTVDTIIAATAYLNDYYLATNNRKDYPMPELQIYKG
jgi:predicted nucleic acid-binding protein